MDPGVGWENGNYAPLQYTTSLCGGLSNLGSLNFPLTLWKFLPASLLAVWNCKRTKWSSVSEVSKSHCCILITYQKDSCLYHKDPIKVVYNGKLHFEIRKSLWRQWTVQIRIVCIVTSCNYALQARLHMQRSGKLLMNIQGRIRRVGKNLSKHLSSYVHCLEY